MEEIVNVGLSRKEWLMVATIVAEAAKGMRDRDVRVTLKELGLNIIKQART